MIQSVSGERNGRLQLLSCVDSGIQIFGDVKGVCGFIVGRLLDNCNVLLDQTMDINADNNCRTLVSTACLRRLSFWHVAHFCNMHCKVLVSQPESVDAGKLASHL